MVDDIYVYHCNDRKSLTEMPLEEYFELPMKTRQAISKLMLQNREYIMWAECEAQTLLDEQRETRRLLKAIEQGAEDLYQLEKLEKHWKHVRDRGQVFKDKYNVITPDDSERVLRALGQISLREH